MDIKTFLDQHQVHYDVLKHEPTFQASELAHVLHLHGDIVAKAVLVHADHGYHDVVAVVPATHQVDLAKLSQALGGAEVHLGTEEDLRKHCPDCEVGVLPPFGSHYGMETMVDQRIAEQREIIIEGNTHDEALRLRFDDFRRLENPLIADVVS